MYNFVFILPGSEKWASSRIRGFWPARYLKKSRCLINQGVPQSEVYIWAKVFDLSKLQALPGLHFWDVCDPSWWFKPQEIRPALQYFDGFVASNEGLRQEFENWSGCKCHLIPDRLELSHYPRRKVHNYADPVRLIWYGAYQNRMSLFGALANIERLRANGYNVELTIFDDRPQEALTMLTAPVYHISWELEKENEIIASHDIALLPKYPGAWGKVKSNNKVLTAWACGLPATDGEDYEWMSNLCAQSALRQQEADRRIEELKSNYDIRQSAEDWAKLIEEYRNK